MRAAEDAESQLLFVYGSLKRGHSNHAQLAGASFQGVAQSAPGYTLYRVGGYPGLAPGGQGAVTGELYAVPAALFERLDEFEGCPWLYERVRIPLSDGRSVYAYVIPDARRGACDERLGETWP